MNYELFKSTKPPQNEDERQAMKNCIMAFFRIRAIAQRKIDEKKQAEETKESKPQNKK